MSASRDSLEFGYDEFYDAYLGVSHNRALMGLSKAPLIHPSDFAAKNPQHVCLAALHGHLLYPSDERTLKDRVKDDGPYAKTLRARMDMFAEMVSEFNALQRRVGWMFGGVTTISLDDEPFTRAAFEQAGLGGTPIAEAALVYEEDREFFSLGHSGRLNHFARHLGFPNVQALTAFMGRLDDEASAMGFPSYAAMCVATRYIDHLLDVYEAQSSAHSALEDLRSKREFLKRESVFTIERFIACRLTEEGKTFHVDVSEEGVLIALYEGPLRGEVGIVTSQFLSDKSPHYHSTWFA